MSGRGAEVVEREVVIVNELGMHARATAKLVAVAARFPCDIELEKDGQRADGKSIMGLLLLCGGPGSRITLRARGKRAKAAVDALAKLIGARFGEER